MVHVQVKRRTSYDNSPYGSHVMQYGDVGLSKDDLFQYMGTNPANDNYTFVEENSLRPHSKVVNQRDADLVHFWTKVCLIFFVPFRIKRLLLIFFLCFHVFVSHALYGLGCCNKKESYDNFVKRLGGLAQEVKEVVW